MAQLVFRVPPIMSYQYPWYTCVNLLFVTRDNVPTAVVMILKKDVNGHGPLVFTQIYFSNKRTDKKQWHFILKLMFDF